MQYLSPSMEDDARARREARKHWTGAVTRSFDEAAKLDQKDAMAIPEGERMRLVWELSLEIHRIARPETPNEPRFDRSVGELRRR